MSMPRRLVGPLGSGAPKSPPKHLAALRRVDDTWRAHARDLGVQLRWSPLVLGAVLWFLLSALGALAAGLLGSLGAGGIVLFIVVFARRLAARRVLRRAQSMLPEICVRLSRTIRSGRSVEEAFNDVVGHVSPLPIGVSRVANQSRTGRPLEVAIDAWIREAESSAERLLSSALHLGVRQGGELATTLDVVGGGLRDDLELDARRRVLLVQATSSAAVLVMLPVVFATVASVLRGGLVFQGRLGVALIAAGLALDAIGCLWMRSLMRGLR